MLMAPPITRRQSELIALLKQLGPGWHTRTEIAAAKGAPNRMSPVDIEALDELAARSFIVERSLEPRRTGEAVSRWVYRLKDDQGDDNNG